MHASGSTNAGTARRSCDPGQEIVASSAPMVPKNVPPFNCKVAAAIEVTLLCKVTLRPRVAYCPTLAATCALVQFRSARRQLRNLDLFDDQIHPRGGQRRLSGAVRVTVDHGRRQTLLLDVEQSLASRARVDSITDANRARLGRKRHKAH